MYRLERQFLCFKKNLKDNFWSLFCVLAVKIFCNFFDEDIKYLFTKFVDEDTWHIKKWLDIRIRTSNIAATNNDPSTQIR